MLIPLSLHAQPSVNQEDRALKLPGFLDNVVPPSPGVAHVVKYADSPVAYSLGLPDITIPIYTLWSFPLR